jgi:4-amino-4-deoxy-L-arabinose transferase-like glycosyltransferase
VACYLRNGWPFIEEFFVRHHFSRVTSDALQHVQPFWFYAPVLAAGLLPWTPMLLLLSERKLYADRKNRFLLAWALFGLLFFSLTLNKLPGYLLPLLPAVFALMGIALARVGKVRWAFAGTVVLLGLLPAIEHILPAALEEGIRRSPWRSAPWWPVLAAAPVAWLASAWVTRGHRLVLSVACGAALVVAATYLKIKVLPLVDEQSTARPLASRVAQAPQQHCVEWMPRALRYGLNYYTVTPLPNCEDDPRPNPIVVLAKDQ